MNFDRALVFGTTGVYDERLLIFFQSQARLQNDLRTVRWNIRKTYLRDLRDCGVSIVPTHWMECRSVETLTPLFAEFDVPRIVVSALDAQPLYGRVDLVRLPDGNPALMELELIEPSLYFPYDPLAPERFADAVVRLMR